MHFEKAREFKVVCDKLKIRFQPIDSVRVCGQRRVRVGWHQNDKLLIVRSGVFLSQSKFHVSWRHHIRIAAGWLGLAHGLLCFGVVFSDGDKFGFEAANY